MKKQLSKEELENVENIDFGDFKGEVYDSYIVRVKGEATTSWSGSVPYSIDDLIKKAGKDTMTLFYQIAKTQIDLLCQAGKTDEAMVVWEKLRQQEFEYACPKMVFRRDLQAGCIYQGAHCFYGAFRDAASDAGIFYKKKGDLLPSDKHFRKYVRVSPDHICLYRPDALIKTPDEEEGQQPVDDVRGFSRYEVVHPPFYFRFNVEVLVAGKFKKFLQDKESVVKTICRSAWNGQGARRAAGYGGWRVTEVIVEDWAYMKDVLVKKAA